MLLSAPETVHYNTNTTLEEWMPLLNHVTPANAATSIARCSSRHLPVILGASHYMVSSETGPDCVLVARHARADLERQLCGRVSTLDQHNWRPTSSHTARHARGIGKRPHRHYFGYLLIDGLIAPHISTTCSTARAMAALAHCSVSMTRYHASTTSVRVQCVHLVFL